MMNDATVTATFDLRNAWNEMDIAETGLQPAKGVNSFLIDEGLPGALDALALRFEMELRRWGVSAHEKAE